jgi:hypothetical protein
VHLPQAVALLRQAPPVLASRGLGDDVAYTFRQKPHGFGERHVFYLHDEAKDVAPRAATEAMVVLLVRPNVEGGGLFFVEGAQASVVLAHSL